MEGRTGELEEGRDALVSGSGGATQDRSFQKDPEVSSALKGDAGVRGDDSFLSTEEGGRRQVETQFPGEFEESAMEMEAFLLAEPLAAPPQAPHCSAQPLPLQASCEVSTAIPRDLGRPAPPLELPVHALTAGLPMRSFPRDKIKYRSFTDRDLGEVRQLHAENFPFLYDEAFYEYLSSRKAVVVVAVVDRADLEAFRLQHSPEATPERPLPPEDSQNAAPELLVGVVSVFQRGPYIRDERPAARLWSARREQELLNATRREMLHRRERMQDEGCGEAPPGLGEERHVAECNLDGALRGPSAAFSLASRVQAASLFAQDASWRSAEDGGRFVEDHARRAQEQAEAAARRGWIDDDEALRLRPPEYLPDAEVEDLAYVSTLAVAAPFRRLGVASQLLRKVMLFLRSPHNHAPTCTLFLHVAEYNDAAIEFYARHGFEQVQYVADYYAIEDRLYGSFLCAVFLHEDCPSCARAREAAVRAELENTQASGLEQATTDFFQGLGSALRLLGRSIGGMLYQPTPQ